MLHLPLFVCFGGFKRGVGARGLGLFGWVGRGSWSPCFSRAFNDWEVVLAEWLLMTIQGKRVSAE